MHNNISTSLNRCLRAAVLCGAVVCAMVCGVTLRALPLDTYASSSRLASGKWYRITVPKSGLYALTATDLRRMGFSNPDRVRIHGYGAWRSTDDLTVSSYVDDLPAVPAVKRADGSIVFYGNGPETWSQSVSGRYVANLNQYANVGTYFVTESDSVAPEFEKVGTPQASSVAVTTFIDRQQHEVDAVTPGEAGTMLVGEDFKYTPSRSFKFTLPGRIEGTDDEVLWMECSFVAKTFNQYSSVEFTVNGEALNDGTSQTINRISPTPNDSHYHGVEGVMRHSLTQARGTDLTIGLRHTAQTSVYGAWLNYLAINYSRALDMNQTEGTGYLKFYLQAASARLANGAAGTQVWEVTDPRNPRVVDAGTDGADLVWTSPYSSMRTYVAFAPDAKLPSPTLVGAVANQDLHAHGPVNMLIVIPFNGMRQQSERIAALHRAEGLTVRVVDADLIYNEFGSGSPDVHALRRYAKMIYDRGAGTTDSLQYILLMGRPTYDHRRNTKAMAEAATPLPGWVGGTMRNSLNDNDGYVTDDYLAMLADGAGLDKGLDDLSVAVGRLPLRTQAEAQNYVDKLYQYVEKSKKSSWRSQIMLLADDDDQGVHMNQTETFCRNLQPVFNQPYLLNKVYIDAYERHGNEYPEARAEMFRNFDEGVAWWLYIGHANNHSMTGDGQVTYNDLNALYLKRLPVLYAATCDFLRWDSETLSGGEILLHERYGGTIGTISATRPVFIYENGLLTAAMGRQMAARDPITGQLRSLGQIYRNAKNNILDSEGRRRSNSNRLRYVLMGDPAMRLPAPDNIVRLDSIDDVSTFEEADDYGRQAIVAARQSALFKGHVSDPLGRPMDEFNGTVTATIYDAEFSTTTRGYGNEGIKMIYDRHGTRLYTGSTRVENGRFALRVNMPAEISDNFRPATITLYAVSDGDTLQATGLNNHFYVSGYDETAPADTVAPVIENFYLNHPTFADGGTVNPSPMAIAQISDDIAINLSLAGIGHQMLLTLDGKKTYTDVAQYYTPADDGIGGTINYPLSDLMPGNHTLALRVWDTDANAATATVNFYVANDVAPKIFDIYTDTNPASTQANFYVSHDRPDQMCTVTVEVCNLLGRVIWSSRATGQSDMFASTPVTWNLCDAAGRRVPRGIYLYRATITRGSDLDGPTSTGSRRIAVTD